MTLWKPKRKIQPIDEESKDHRDSPLPGARFPAPNIEPRDLIGHIVQISLDKYELGGPHMLLPPLRVTSYAEGKRDKSETPRIAFLGTPLGPFRGTGHREAKFTSIKSVEFHSVSPALPPHFLLDKAFVSFCKNINYSPPVVVYGTTVASTQVSSAMLASGKGFFYVGYGMLQIFREGVGFDVAWPEPDPWLEDLGKNERLLLAYKGNGDVVDNGGGSNK